MPTAFVCSFYTASGGAEKVDDVIAGMFPEAELFALFAKETIIPMALKNRPRHLSYLASIPSIEKYYRLALPFYASAMESLDLRGYDLILSSERVLSKAVLVDQQATHICYCHTPWRQIWDLYLDAMESVPAPLRPVYARAARNLRAFDFMAAQRVDHFVANSRYIAQRILKYYGRSSTVIYPPVDTSKGYLKLVHDDYYLSVGRLSPTKRVEILIGACNRLGRRLIVVGEGREEKRLKAISGPTIEFAGAVDDSNLNALYANCRALLFAANEDFGLVPVEAQSYGRPVIAYGHGGSLETIRVGDLNELPDTGVFFSAQTIASAMEGIKRFETAEGNFTPTAIREHACKFDTSIFVSKMTAFIEDAGRHHISRSRE
jgi:glycosyltransferase involved in cell wall biosynthesis